MAGAFIVFPTPVGVFLKLLASASAWVSLPHARGGVSAVLPLRAARAASSPRPWGCFLRFVSRAAKPPVFPTPVGVFPPYLNQQKLDCRLPHARGGVSYP